MTDNAKAMVLASLAADSLALGVHWVYNTRVIDRKYGRLEQMIKPEMARFHKGRDKGELTHYGDQTLVLLASLAQKGGEFDLERFARDWQDLFASYDGYLDKATQTTLSNFKAGKQPPSAGSDSSELAGASRIAPLVYSCRNDLDRLLAAAGQQTIMTHNNPQVIASAEFFARVAWEVLGGEKPSTAVARVTDSHFNTGPIAEWVEDATATVTADTRSVINDFGQMCNAEAAFPGVIHLILKYEDNLKEALVENIMAGGDSAARGLLAGMVLGAGHGMEAIDRQWLADLKCRQQALELLGQIDRESASTG